MALANTAHSYGLLTKTFHWLTALLILTLIPLGIIANKLPYETSEQLAQKAWLFSLHKTLGVTMFFVALLRILWALRQIKPNGLHPERKAENWLAETVHWLLYGSLVLVPLSGWIHHAATTGFAPIWWHLGQTLPFVPKDESIAQLFSGLHIVFERVLILSLVLHVIGALKHHFVDKDATLKRMWFRKVTLPETQITHSHALPFASALFAWLLALFVGSTLGLFAHQSDTPNTPELAAVQSDWAVQDGTLDIVVTQFGSAVQGRFSDWTASIQLDPVTGFGSTDVTIAIASLTLGSVTNQAMGPDFFDSTLFPTAQFQADISPIPDGYLAKGTLTIRDQSLPFEMPFSMAIDGDTATMNTITYLDRRDFNVGNTMADESSLKFEVQVKVNLTATRTAANES